RLWRCALRMIVDCRDQIQCPLTAATSRVSAGMQLSHCDRCLDVGPLEVQRAQSAAMRDLVQLTPVTNPLSRGVPAIHAWVVEDDVGCQSVLVKAGPRARVRDLRAGLRAALLVQLGLTLGAAERLED